MTRLPELQSRQSPQTVHPEDSWGRATLIDGCHRIPAAVHSLPEFRRWALSPRFPDRGRIDYVAGDVEVYMSPEDLFTHGAVKTAIAAKLHTLVSANDSGHVFVDRSRVTCPAAELSVEPDVVVVLWTAVESGRVRHVPAATQAPGRFVEIEGAPDLIVEITSDRSVEKDTVRLPRLYALAGVPEFWLVDARGTELVFQIHSLRDSGYVVEESDPEGWATSSVLGCRFRLQRRPGRHASWYFHLDHSSAS